MEDQSNILIVDLESTCDQDGSILRHEVEIIEIGAVIGILTSADFVVLDDFQVYVKPVINPNLTAFCKELTGIKQSGVDSGVTLNQAFDELRVWVDGYSLQGWASWGKFDLTQVSMEAQAKELPNPLAEFQHFNLKQLFARQHKHRVGLARAVTMMGLEFEGSHHSGLDDARNIGRVLKADPLLREIVIKRCLSTSLEKVDDADQKLESGSQSI